MNVLRFCLAILAGMSVGSPLLAEESPELAVELVSFNIRFPSEDDGDNRWKHRRKVLFDTVRQMDPDVMGVQEAFASQLKEIAAEVKGYGYVGVGRDDGKEEGEHAAVFYRKERFDLEDEGTFWLSDTPDVVASNTWEAACNRVCTWATLRERSTGRTFSVYNAHYDHRSARARESSPVVIVEQMVRRGHHRGPLILMGDFNSGPESPQMDYLLKGVATLQGEQRLAPVTFENTFTAEDPSQAATFHGWRGTTGGRQIDYVLVARGTEHRVAESGIVRHHEGERYPSDHYPVRARVIFP